MVKMVSLSDDVYIGLKLLKGRKSFSEIIRENIINKKKKRDIMDSFGALRESADEWKKIEKKIYDDRKKFKLRSYKL